MDLTTVVFIIFGSALTITGIVLFIKMGTEGASSIKMFGFEFKLGGSALVIVVLGVMLFMVPVLYKERTGSRATQPAVIVESEEQRPRTQDTSLTIPEPRAAKAPGHFREQLGKPQYLPSVDEIFDRYIEALGGKIVLGAIHSRITKGTVEANGTVGELLLLERAPNKHTQLIHYPDGTTSASVFDGINGWIGSSKAGVVRVTGDALADEMIDSDFEYDLRTHGLFTEFRVLGIETIRTKLSYVVAATPRSGSVRKYYFDVSSGVLARTVTLQRGQNGPEELVNDNLDLCKLGGVLYPCTIRLTFAGAPAAIVHITAVEHNVEIPERFFERPTL